MFLKKILISLMVLFSSEVVADNVSDWCGYNKNTIGQLRMISDQKILVSSFNMEDIEEMLNVYETLDYNRTMIWDKFKSDWTNQRGPGFNILNKIIPKDILNDTGIMKSIVAEIVWHEKIDKKGFLFSYYKIYNGNSDLLFIINPKFLLLNVAMAEKGIKISEEAIIKASFDEKFNPCH